METTSLEVARLGFWNWLPTDFGPHYSQSGAPGHGALYDFTSSTMNPRTTVPRGERYPLATNSLKNWGGFLAIGGQQHLGSSISRLSRRSGRDRPTDTHLDE